MRRPGSRTSGHRPRQNAERSGGGAGRPRNGQQRPTPPGAASTVSGEPPPEDGLRSGVCAAGGQCGIAARASARKSKQTIEQSHHLPQTPQVVSVLHGLAVSRNTDDSSQGDYDHRTGKARDRKLVCARVCGAGVPYVAERQQI